MSGANQQGQPVNPYAKKPRSFNAHDEENVGRQSQQRVSNQHKRKCKLCSNNNSKRKKGDQLTLEGTVAFQSDRDCRICKAKSIAKFCPGYPIPKRAHHTLCIHNKRTKGCGVLTSQGMANLDDVKRYKALTAPIQPSEQHSGVYATKAAGDAFFAKKPAATLKRAPSLPMLPLKEPQPALTPNDLCQAVVDRVEDSNLCEKHKAKGAPLAMLALAEEVVEKVIRTKETLAYFNGMTLTVPHCENAYHNPHYHSTVGQKLMLVDWEHEYKLDMSCPAAACQGVLRNTRTNFSKNKTLFPIYGIEGPPIWCIVQSMACSCCKRQFAANDGNMLVNLPPHVANEYPVSANYVSANSTSHVSRNATEVFASIMITYGNGELCSKLLCDAINRSYVRRIEGYCSYALLTKKVSTTECIPKDGCFIKQYPPLGDTIRDLYNKAALSDNNRWRISDFERHTREIQGVKLDGGIFAQDHTFEPIKNYMKSVGAKAAWDAATQTGEIASVVLVRSTKTQDFAHAAQQLLKQEHFKPTVMYSDTWPNKKEFWQQQGLDGRLGLFHYQKRIISTLKKNHIDFFDAVTDLLASLYACCPEDYEKLLTALKNGSLSRTNRKCTSSEITDMKGTKTFRDQCAKHLRKQMHEKQKICQLLDDLFCKHKVTSSDPQKRPARGRLDPIRLIPLFAADAKIAVENCKEKAEFLADPMPLEKMYQKLLPNPNSSHQLTEFLSLRGESKLEAFHDRFAHFANCGMRDTLADNLNLAGTTWYNIAIRHVRGLVSKNNIQNPLDTDQENRRKMPSAWEKIVPCCNHSELWYINNMAKSVGCQHLFPVAEVLVPDNGERFFSQCLTKTLPALGPAKFGEHGECLCNACVQTTTRTNDDMVETIQMMENTMNNNKTAPTAPVAKRTTVPTAASNRKQPVNNAASRVTQQRTIANPVSYYQPMQHYAQMLPAQQTFLPMHFQLPLHLAPQPCCDKCAVWLQHRKGRPPYHHLCRCR